MSPKRAFKALRSALSPKSKRDTTHVVIAVNDVSVDLASRKGTSLPSFLRERLRGRPGTAAPHSADINETKATKSSKKGGIFAYIRRGLRGAPDVAAMGDRDDGAQAIKKKGPPAKDTKDGKGTKTTKTKKATKSTKTTKVTKTP